MSMAHKNQNGEIHVRSSYISTPRISSGSRNSSVSAQTAGGQRVRPAECAFLPGMQRKILTVASRLALALPHAYDCVVSVPTSLNAIAPEWASSEYRNQPHRASAQPDPFAVGWGSGRAGLQHRGVAGSCEGCGGEARAFSDWT
jgi:hypothetical protein